MSVVSHLSELRKKHEALSSQVEQAERRPGSDTVAVRQLKKEKLRLKERIERLS